MLFYIKLSTCVEKKKPIYNTNSALQHFCSLFTRISFLRLQAHITREFYSIYHQELPSKTNEFPCLIQYLISISICFVNFNQLVNYRMFEIFRINFEIVNKTMVNMPQNLNLKHSLNHSVQNTTMLKLLRIPDTSLTFGQTVHIITIPLQQDELLLISIFITYIHTNIRVFLNYKSFSIQWSKRFSLIELMYLQGSALQWHGIVDFC